MIDFQKARQKISSLPIYPYLDEICENLKNSPSRFLVLTAETAAGKSTALPLAILQHFPGKILMLEPRRLAATAISDRLSSLLEEENGQTVGYRLHLDSKVSKSTRLEVLTEAILTRRLQSDPLIEDVNVVILDEFHERSIHADLALAFLKESMQLREDLYVIIMSATIDYQPLSQYLGSPENPAPIMKIPGRQFPVNIQWKANLSMAQAIVEEIQVANDKKENLLTNDSSINQNLKEKTPFRMDTILCFLPGIYEIRKTKSQLEEALLKSNLDGEILILHSSLPLSEQRKVLSPCPLNSKRRIILSSAIAETSLTVPGVTLVIDSGFCRLNKMNHSLGMERLVTEKESNFSAEQRSGRAGRIAAGKCIRLWDKNDPRLQKPLPEILRSDLSQLVLECKVWGADSPDKLLWLDKPSSSAWKSSENLLEMLGCLDSTPAKKITEKGKIILKLGLDPRLSSAALCGNARAILPFSEFAQTSAERQEVFIKDLEKRLEKCGPECKKYALEFKDFPPILAGYPDRLARCCEGEKNRDSADYQFPSGRKALLSRDLLAKNKVADFPLWIIAPEVDAGEKTGRIYSFQEVDSLTIDSYLSDKTRTFTKTSFTNAEIKDFKKGNFSIQKIQYQAYGQLILSEKKLSPNEDDFSGAVCSLIQEKGIFSLPLDSQSKEKIESLLLRAEFFCKESNSPDSSEILEKVKCLEEKTKEWLLPFITGQKIDGQIIFNGLYWYLNGEEIDRQVPLQITLTNGRKRKIHYEKSGDGKIQPVLEIIIQQIFGCFESPRILGHPLLLRLLSPASRPLQVTDDLGHFWESTWPEICREMKGRYPKHNWDYRVAQKEN